MVARARVGGEACRCEGWRTGARETWGCESLGIGGLTALRSLRVCGNCTGLGVLALWLMPGRCGTPTCINRDMTAHRYHFIYWLSSSVHARSDAILTCSSFLCPHHHAPNCAVVGPNMRLKRRKAIACFSVHVHRSANPGPVQASKRISEPSTWPSSCRPRCS